MTYLVTPLDCRLFDCITILLSRYRSYPDSLTVLLPSSFFPPGKRDLFDVLQIQEDGEAAGCTQPRSSWCVPILIDLPFSPLPSPPLLTVASSVGAAVCSGRRHLRDLGGRRRGEDGWAVQHRTEHETLRTASRLG